MLLVEWVYLFGKSFLLSSVLVFCCVLFFLRDLLLAVVEYHIKMHIILSKCKNKLQNSKLNIERMQTPHVTLQRSIKYRRCESVFCCNTLFETSFLLLLYAACSPVSYTHLTLPTS